MRLLINFFLYGMLFYLLWRYFPDGFHTLVNWADQLFNFLYDLFHSTFKSSSSAAPATSKQALSYLFSSIW